MDVIKRKLESNLHDTNINLDVETKRVKTESTIEDKHKSVNFKRIKRQKYVVMLCFSGENYYGMQINNPFLTIEGEILKTFLKLEIINQEEYDKIKLINFQRASRIDKGVSATKQVISVKLPETFPSKLSEINNNLPENIRIFDIRRTNPSFNAKNCCDYRTYSYLFPSFAISNIEEILDLNYRLNKSRIIEFNKILQIFKGTHNFFNFTSGKIQTDPSTTRYIISIDCSDPFEHDEMEFCKINVKGQSFLIRQIRKMIGLAFSIMRGFAKPETIDKAFTSKKRLDIPIAPSLGLMLEEVHYDNYNLKLIKTSVHQPIIWDEYNDDILKFKEKYIWSTIFKKEKEQLSMLKWLETLSLHTFDELDENKLNYIRILSKMGTTSTNVTEPNCEINALNAEDEKLDKNCLDV